MIVELAARKSAQAARPSAKKNNKSLRMNDTTFSSDPNNAGFKVLSKSQTTDLFSEKHSELRQMHKLTKQSHKNLRITLGKNIQEETRLGLVHNVLAKTYAHEDHYWVHEVVQIRSSLDQIGKATEPYVVRDLTPSFNYTPSASRKYKKRSESAQSILKIPEKDTSPKKQVMFARSAPQERTEPSSQIMREVKSVNDCDTWPISDLSETDDTKDFVKMYFKRDYSALSYTSGADDNDHLPRVDNLKSYTSLVNPCRDRSKAQLHLINLTFADLPARSPDVEPVAQPDKGEQVVTLEKSVRRPLQRAGSYTDIFFRLKSLETKVKYCQWQNRINFNLDDPNIRYGNKLPARKIYRQLRILSRFEEIFEPNKLIRY